MINNKEKRAIEAFQAIRSDIPDLEEQDQPNYLPEIMENNDNLEETYQLALDLWLSSFNPNELKELINQYLKLVHCKEKTKNLQVIKKKLKKIRKAGLIFGTAKHFCHNESPLPSDFIKFLKIMGKLADHFEDEQGPEKAKKILEITENVSNIDLGYISTDIDEYKLRIEVFKNRAQTFLKEDKLTIPNFHKLRKELLHIMNLYQIAAARDLNNKDVLRTFQFLVKLNSKLGDIHDVFVAKKISGEIDYENSTMTIPDDIKQILKNFYQQL